MTYRHAGGISAPVKNTGYGNATPATIPSTRSRTSLKGPRGNVKSEGISSKNWSAILPYCKAFVNISEISISLYQWNYLPRILPGNFQRRITRHKLRRYFWGKWHSADHDQHQPVLRKTGLRSYRECRRDRHIIGHVWRQIGNRNDNIRLWCRGMGPRRFKEGRSQSNYTPSV